jgi:hypothetical protein
MSITIQGDGNQFQVQIVIKWRPLIALAKALAAAIAAIIVLWPHIYRLGTLFGWW